MLSKKIMEIKKSLTHSQFVLAMRMYCEDVKFHKQYRVKCDKELCDVLEQAANIARRF